MDWIAKKDRERFGVTIVGAALEDAVMAGAHAMEVAERVANEYMEKEGLI
jgi:hypothetical protein